MVWGMRLPDSFGEFWPEGDFEYDPKAKDSGWSNRLRLHYLAQSPEEQIRLFDYRGFDHGGQGIAFGAASYPSYVSGKFRCETGTKDGPDSLMFAPVEVHEAPQSFEIEKSSTPLGSMIKLNDRILAVDEDFKDIMDRIEPDIHHFFPIEIKDRKGISCHKRYFTIVVNQYIDGYISEKSDESKKDLSGRCFSRDVTEGAHLWRDRKFPLVNCLSDMLKDECDKAGLRLPKHYKMKLQ